MGSIVLKMMKACPIMLIQAYGVSANCIEIGT